MTAEARRVLVDCDGAATHIGTAQQDWAARRVIRTVGPEADLDLNLIGLGGSLLSVLSSRSADLLRLAAYVYRADQLVSRGGSRDAHGDRWRRHFLLCMPMSDPAFWANAAAHDWLGAPLRFLTDDLWEFAFTPAPPELQQLPLDVPVEDIFGTPTTVVPLSGGIDSLCVG